MEKLAVTPGEAFAMIGIGKTKGWELVKLGEIEAFKIGAATRITTASVRAFVARQLKAA